jgi:type I restriction enzyme M protein
MLLSHLFKDSNYELNQFSPEQIAALENRISIKNEGAKQTAFIECLVRKKPIKLTPEEAVRQLYIAHLIHHYEYPVERIKCEYPIVFGKETKRADIVITDKDDSTALYIVVEVKKPKLKEGKEQLKSYCNASGASIAVWTNGGSISRYHRKDPNYFEEIQEIPKANEKLSSILSNPWYIADLIKNDTLLKNKKSLKSQILELEDEVLANAGVDIFEEIFKLIFTKLYDELESSRNERRRLEFRNYGDTEKDLYKSIQALFDNAKKKWSGIFSSDARINLTPSHLSIRVGSLEGVKLFNSNLDVIDEAFEYLINKTSKGEKGQYFTPRYVIDMCVKMLNPQSHESVMDTAAGSCGFPIHAVFHVWKQQLAELGLSEGHLFTAEKKPVELTDYVKEKVFGIDFDEKAVRVHGAHPAGLPGKHDGNARIPPRHGRQSAFTRVPFPHTRAARSAAAGGG